MGARGEVRLRNDGQPHTLRIKGWIPLEFLKEPPTLEIRIQGQLLDSFLQREAKFERSYDVPARTLGSGPTVLLTIATDKIAHAPHDARDLGVSIEQVEWQAGP
jgi:hypothetical protein